METPLEFDVAKLLRDLPFHSEQIPFVSFGSKFVSCRVSCYSIVTIKFVSSPLRLPLIPRQFRDKILSLSIIKHIVNKLTRGCFFVISEMAEIRKQAKHGCQKVL